MIFHRRVLADEVIVLALVFSEVAKIVGKTASL